MSLPMTRCIVWPQLLPPTTAKLLTYHHTYETVRTTKYHAAQHEQQRKPAVAVCTSIQKTILLQNSISSFMVHTCQMNLEMRSVEVVVKIQLVIVVWWYNSCKTNNHVATGSRVLFTVLQHIVVFASMQFKIVFKSRYARLHKHFIPPFVGFLGHVLL